MAEKRKMGFWLICLFIWLTAGTVSAGSGGAVPKGQGTDIMAGVVVDYMGKLKFIVLDRDTLHPIPGSSIEIYIPSIGRYVLCGLTDDDGVYELDIAYLLTPGLEEKDQFDSTGGEYRFHGTVLYLSSNEIRYRVYKSGWLLYPHTGSERLNTREIPQVITVYLYQPHPGGSGSLSGGSQTGSGKAGAAKSGESRLADFMEVLKDLFPESGGIPKTGIDGAILYWACGLICFLFAGLLIWMLLKGDHGNENK